MQRLTTDLVAHSLEITPEGRGLDPRDLLVHLLVAGMGVDHRRDGIGVAGEASVPTPTREE
jgi:hypothetical protein